MAVDIQRITGISAKIAARLCNFPTGRADLLPAHIDFLDKEVAAVIRGMQGPWVDLLFRTRRQPPLQRRKYKKWILPIRILPRFA